jgi:hypothetical protein
MKKRTKIILILVLAIFLIMATTFGGVKVFKKSDLYAVSCGWPLHFIVQDQGWRDPPYPYRVPCPACPLENPTKFYWERFIFDIVFFYLLIQALLYSGNTIAKKIRRKKHHIRT